jgi:hypothetical protein
MEHQLYTEPSQAFGLEPDLPAECQAPSSIPSPPVTSISVPLVGLPAQLHTAISVHSIYKNASGAWHSNLELTCSESEAPEC